MHIEGDYNILKSKEYYDVHAVSGLLKLYLRELPSSVLTRALHMDFVRVVELQGRAARVNRLGQLVSDLPLPNYTLLRTLVSHLIRVISKADVNKMNVRNVGIVFAPTLGVPAAIFTLLVVEFPYVFFVGDDGNAAPIQLEEEEADVLVKETIYHHREDQRELPPLPVSPTASLSSPTSPKSTTSSLRSLRGQSLLMDTQTGRSNRNSLIYSVSAPDLVVKESVLSSKFGYSFKVSSDYSTIFDGRRD